MFDPTKSACPGRVTANHNQTIVRAPGWEMQHNQTVVRAPEPRPQHNQTLVRQPWKHGTQHNQTVVVDRG